MNRSRQHAESSTTPKSGFFATLSNLLHGSGTGAPSSRRAPLAAVAVIAGLAFTAAPALAAPPTTTTPVLSEVSYTSVHVEGKVTSDGSGPFNGSSAFRFQYSTDGTHWTTGFGETLFGEFTDREVGGPISGLSSATHYFVRLVAQNGVFPSVDESISPGPDPSFTTLTVDPPAIPGAVEADSVFSTSATAKAVVKRPANTDPTFDVNCHFEFISDALFDENVTNIGPGAGFTGANSADCAENPITKDSVDSEGEEAVTAPLAGLSPSMTYHLRLVAKNAAPGSVTKDAPDFTTTAKVAGPTVISTDDAAEVTVHGAKFSGEVQRPAGADPALDVNCRFEFVSDKQFNETGFAGAPSAPCVENPITAATADGEGKQVVHSEFNGFNPATTWHLRLSAENEGGVDTEDADATFTTLPAELPTVTIDPVAAGTYTTAHVSGTVDSTTGDHYARVQFEISTDNVNWSGVEVSGEAVPPAYKPEYDYSALQPSTTYFFRIAATYSNLGFAEAEASGEVAFSPEPNPEITTESLFAPTATIDPVSNVTGTGAHLSGTVDSHAPAGPLSELGKETFATHWQFECTPECPDPRLSGVVQGEEGSKVISVDIDRLRANSFYEVTLHVKSEGGEETTETKTFQTPLVTPDVRAEPGASDGEGGYTIQGVINSNNSKLTRCEFEWGPNNSYPNAFKAPCLPFPSGPDEVQLLSVEALQGQYRLSFRGQTTADLDYNATPAEVQSALEALSSVGSGSVSVADGGAAIPEVFSYAITFTGKLAGANIEPLKVSDGTTPPSGGSGASVSTTTEGGTDHPITVEAHLTGLTVGATYHFRIFATNAAGDASSVDRTFTPILNPKEACPNEQLRKENSSLTLPECRAYEMVTPPDKAGYGAELVHFDDGDAVAFQSKASNIANSGLGLAVNYYSAIRTDTGWQTRANLNGPTGSVYDGPEAAQLGQFETGPPVFSKDLLSTVYEMVKKPIPGFQRYLRRPDGTFALLGGVGSGGSAAPLSLLFVGASDDFSRQVYNGYAVFPAWGPGVYEAFGTDAAQLRRVDVDDAAAPISTCVFGNANGTYQASSAIGNAVSTDGRVVVFSVAGGCGGANPPAAGIWARIDATTTVEVSASRCHRTAADPGGLCRALSPAICSAPDACNSPDDVDFQAASADGSRVFFTTTQQLLDSDTDQTTDLYACDLPAAGGPGDSCTSLTEISGAAGGAEVMAGPINELGRPSGDVTVSADGSTALFRAKGVLADNTDALGETAVPGDDNLYVWHQDSGHPGGQVKFLARLEGEPTSAQSTPDGRYLVLTTADQLVETDTDDARDVYRYDVEAGVLKRVSTDADGVSGNVDGFDADAAGSAISDDGQKIVFTTAEGLAASDGNGDPDVYLWTPRGVRLISAGSGLPLLDTGGDAIRSPAAAVDGSGEDIYFETAAALTPADGDEQSDVYDARVGGGFGFAEQICTGEGCQPPILPAPPGKPRATERSSTGNPTQPKPCPKGKVRKHGKCVKKASKKHHHNKSHKKNKRTAGNNRGDNK